MLNSKHRKDKIFKLLNSINKEIFLKKKLASSQNIERLLSGDITLYRNSELSSDKELVKFLQKKLMDAGIDLPKYGADGVIGRETEEAIKEAQNILIDNDVIPKSLVVPGVADYLLIKSVDELASLRSVNRSQTKEMTDVSLKMHEISNERKDINTTIGSPVYIGSSSMVGELGKIIKSILGEGKTFAKEGTQPMYWTGNEWDGIQEALSERPNKVVIVTGGNGISGMDQLLAKIKNSLKQFNSDHTEIIWIGSNPFGADSFDNSGRPYNSKTSYTYLNSPDGFRQATSKRKDWNSQIMSAVESVGGIFIDPFDYLVLDDGSPGFVCKSCDGIHLPQDVARFLVSQISGIL